MAVFLYPAKSPYWNVAEKLIYLRIGKYSGRQLLDMLPGDLRDLAAYHCISSLEAENTLLDRFKIHYLRYLKPLNINEKFISPYAKRNALYIIMFIAKPILGIAIKSVGVALIIMLALYFGYPEVAERFDTHPPTCLPEN